MKLITILSVALALAVVSCVTESRIPGFPRGQAPDFKGTAVLNEKFEQLSLSDYKGKYVALLFYPFDFTFVCPTELIAFSDNHSKFEALNAQVIGISVDSQFSHLAWLRTPRSKGGVGKLTYPLFADVSKEVSSAYGVLVTDKKDELHGAALRGLFIIDPKGQIRHMQITDAPVGRDYQETLRLIEAFQYVDTHGEVCPHGWKKGQKTIIPNPDDKLKYFNTVFDD